MEKQSTTENCQNCLRPVIEAGTNPTTQWVSFCKCGRTYSPNAQFSIDVCANCNKRVPPNKFIKTNGLFLCSCENPDPKSVPNFQRERNQPEPVTLELTAAGLSPDSFPIEKYNPIAILGQGSRADVILARDRQSGKKVAVKCFKQISQASFGSFEQDAKKNKQLTHNNIARLIDYGVLNKQTPYLVTEYKDGFNLEQVLAIHGYPSPDVAVMILIQVCEALIYAQKESLLHRDIRAGNIIFLDDLNSEPSAAITDFALPKVKAAEQLTEPKDAFYMSADQARNLDYDERSEVYSLGCVGFALLTGQPPFREGTALDIKNAHALKLPPRIPNLNFNPERPKDLEEVIERCLEKDPRTRFDTVAKLLERLEVFPRREKMQIAAIEAAKQRAKLLKIIAVVAVFVVISVVGYLALNRH